MSMQIEVSMWNECGMYDSLRMKVSGIIPSNQQWGSGKNLRAKIKVVTEHQLISDAVLNHVMHEFHGHNPLKTEICTNS